MTTQENIAKHLGVNLNESFRVAEWDHPIYHVDPIMGVVTKDGDRLSSVILQELLFGKITIIKLGKQKFHFNIIPYNFSLESSDVNLYLEVSCIKLESLNKHLCYYGAISSISTKFVYEYMNNLSLADFKKFFDHCLGRATLQEIGNISCEFNETILSHVVYTFLVQKVLRNIAYNMLVRYVRDTGLNTTMPEHEVLITITNIADDACVGDTPQGLINLLIKRTENSQ